MKSTTFMQQMKLTTSLQKMKKVSSAEYTSNENSIFYALFLTTIKIGITAQQRSKCPVRNNACPGSFEIVDGEKRFLDALFTWREDNFEI
jgi:hypothetical protein